MVAAQHENVKNENSKHCTKAHSFLFKHDNNGTGGRVASEHRHSAWTRDPAMCGRGEPSDGRGGAQSAAASARDRVRRWISTYLHIYTVIHADI